jgi:hypothetical protein
VIGGGERGYSEEPLLMAHVTDLAPVQRALCWPGLFIAAGGAGRHGLRGCG